MHVVRLIPSEAITVINMRSKQTKWLTLGLTSVLLGGCSAGGVNQFTSGVRNAFQKTRVCLLKGTHAKGSSRQSCCRAEGATAAASSTWMPTIVDQNTTAWPGDHLEVVPDTQSQSQSVVEATPSNRSQAESLKTFHKPAPIEYYMPPGRTPETQIVTPPSSPSGQSSRRAFDALTPLDFDKSSEANISGENTLPNTLPKGNSMPPANELPGEIEPAESTGGGFDEISAPANNDASNETLRMLESINAGAEAEADVNEGEEETSVFESASLQRRLAFAEPKPTEAPAVDTANQLLPMDTVLAEADREKVDTKILTLTARPVQSHRVQDSDSRRSLQTDTVQVTHKRTFRRQNSLRPQRPRISFDRYEHTANANPTVHFKPLPAMEGQQDSAKSTLLENNRHRDDSKSNVSDDQPSATFRRLPEPGVFGSVFSHQQKETARRPLLRVTNASQASITSLKNFTNVRDLELTTSSAATDQQDDEGEYYRRQGTAASVAERTTGDLLK